VRRVIAPIRREMRRLAAVEPVIRHMKAEHRMGRNHLRGHDGDRINAVLAAGQLQLRSAPALAREALACPHHCAARRPMVLPNRLKNAPQRFFTDDLLDSSAKLGIRA